jgi:putative DNA primase/helicase
VVVNQLDTDSHVLNVLNGTLNLRTGVLNPHKSEDLITKLAPVEYNPAALCPIWDAFLSRILNSNTKLIQFLQEAVGYSLTGDISEQVMFLLYGTGANGKSTFLETITDMFGDYWTKMNSETLVDVKRSAGSASEDVARLAGARLVTAVEIPPGRPMNTALVKELTGGDTAQARFLYKPSFTFRPQFKAFMAMNQKPTIHDPTEGIWRRIRLVPFTVTIPPNERDKNLPAKLHAELPGILAWSVQGCLAWQKSGLSTPSEVIAATENYRAEHDVLAGFLADRCVIGPTHDVLSKDLRTAYEDWCKDAGEEPFNPTMFGRCLNERGFPSARTHRGRVRKGLALASSTSP